MYMVFWISGYVDARWLDAGVVVLCLLWFVRPGGPPGGRAGAEPFAYIGR